MAIYHAFLHIEFENRVSWEKQQREGSPHIFQKSVAEIRRLTAWEHENLVGKKAKTEKAGAQLMDSQLYWCKQTNVSLLLRLRLCWCDTGMDRKTLQSPYVLLQDCGSPTLFSLLLSFALNLWVGLNDPCVLGICYPKLGVCTQHHTSGMAQVKCRSQIVTHTWEQEKASLFSLVLFFLSPSSRWFLYFQDGGWEKKKKK